MVPAQTDRMTTSVHASGMPIAWRRMISCGLNTAALFTGDVTADPLVAVDGELPVRPIEVADPATWLADPATQALWRERLAGLPEAPGGPDD